MEKLVVFKEEEFNQLLVKFAKELAEDWKKDWGYKIISRDTGEDILEYDNAADDNRCMCGALVLAWMKTFNKQE